MNAIKKYKNLIRLVVALLLFFCSSIFAYIPIYLFNIDIENINDTTYYALQLFCNFILALILFLMYRRELIEDAKKFVKNFWDNADVAVRYWVVGLVVMAISNILISSLTPSKVATNEAGVQEIITTVPMIAFFLTTFVAPFTEEMIFRKSFKDVLKNKYLYILVSGFVFGFLHVISVINSPYDLLYIIPYGSLGIAFATICYKTDNIFSSIFVHMLHNGVLTLMSIITMGVILL